MGRKFRISGAANVEALFSGPLPNRASDVTGSPQTASFGGPDI